MHNGDLFTDVLHIRNMEQKIIKLFDWILCGHISDLAYKSDFFENAYKSKLIELNNLHRDISRFRDENLELMDVIRRHKEKEARIKQQKRESYLRKKKK